MHLLNTKTFESKVYYSVSNEARLKKSISHHPFNRSVTIIHPSDKYKFDDADLPRYYRARICLSDLLDGSLYYAVHHKQVSGLSVTRIDTENSFCLHEGILTMSLMKETYQRAGLEGQKSRMEPGKWNVRIDFSVKEFSGTKLCKRLKMSFDSVFTTPLDMMFMVTHDDEDEGPSTTDWVGMQVTKSREYLADRTIPEFHALSRIPESAKQDLLFTEQQEDILTHLSLLSVPETVPSSVDPYISTYACPTPNHIESISSTTLEGFISSDYIFKVLEEMRASGCAWSCLHIRGFEHTPEAWIGCEHGYLMGGENCITILSYQSPESSSSTNLAMWEILGSRDTYS